MNDITHLVLHGETPISINKYYSGMHWSKRKAEADRVHLIVRSMIDPNQAPYNVPVDIEVVAYFKNRRFQFDASNVPLKLYEDGLKGFVIQDDTPEYVRSVKSVSLIDRDNPRVEIIVRPSCDQRTVSDH